MRRIIFFLIVFCFWMAGNQLFAAQPEGSQNIFVTDYLPENYVLDGSECYEEYIQAALDDAAKMNQMLVFPPMKYLVNEKGLKVASNLTISMYGAVFMVDKSCDRDGQVFIGQDAEHVNFWGGEIAGAGKAWRQGVNIRGVLLTGSSKDIRIKDMYIHDLTSNGIGVLGTEETPIVNVWISDCFIDNCCNFYGDYQSERPGPEPDSDRKDQGSVAFYYVHEFNVTGCRLERSRSDGTHFYRCKNGQFSGNKVYASQMGGYFLETCLNVTATDNIVADNGSRGVTIERGSFNCTFTGNVVSNSGRQGLWAPNSVGLTVTANIFDKNGRKPNGNEKNRIWNANITVNAAHDPTKTETRDYMIANNIIYTTSSQIAAIHIDSDKAEGIVVKDNLLKGDNQQILIDGDNKEGIVVSGNH